MSKISDYGAKQKFIFQFKPPKLQKYSRQNERFRNLTTSTFRSCSWAGLRLTELSPLLLFVEHCDLQLYFFQRSVLDFLFSKWENLSKICSAAFHCRSQSDVKYSSELSQSQWTETRPSNIFYSTEVKLKTLPEMILCFLKWTWDGPIQIISYFYYFSLEQLCMSHY